MWIYKSDLSKDDFLSCGNEYSIEYISQLRAEYNKYKSCAVTALPDELFDEFKTSGARLGYEREYFKRRTMLRDFALMTWLFTDEYAAHRLSEVLAAICTEHTWALPAHIDEDENTIDLFAAETAQAITEIISLTGDMIDDKVTEKCIDEVKKRVLTPFMTRKQKYGWETSKSNWSAVCGGCVGMCALYLIASDSEAKKAADGLRETFHSYIDSFTDDGACLEGLGYWNYGMTYFTAFTDLYAQRMGEAFFTDSGKLNKIADFAYKCCMGGGYTISFSDSSECCGIYSGLIYKLNELYGARIPHSRYIEGFNGDECGRWCRAARDAAWSRPVSGVSARVSEVLCEAQWAILHSETMSAVFKGGSNDEPHNHNDIGGIIVRKNENILLNDLGAGEYTRDYFSDKRYNILTNRSGGHSVPIINNEEQKSGGEYKAKDFSCGADEASADISGAYGIYEINAIVRRVACRDNAITVKDCFDTAGKIQVAENFITRHSAEIENQAVKIIKNGICIGIIKSENPCSICINTLPHREHDGRVTKITAVDFIFTCDGKYEFTVNIM